MSYTYACICIKKPGAQAWSHYKDPAGPVLSIERARAVYQQLRRSYIYAGGKVSLKQLKEGTVEEAIHKLYELGALDRLKEHKKEVEDGFKA